mmetsp:Transcript_1062/g.3929  ORF Transcript_1062/g.3929 Transcript_1062/m.3929 type:complete len:474 (+) Transcript_1062:43-1464(+)
MHGRAVEEDGTNARATAAGSPRRSVRRSLGRAYEPHAPALGEVSHDRALKRKVIHVRVALDIALEVVPTVRTHRVAHVVLEAVESGRRAKAQRESHPRETAAHLKALALPAVLRSSRMDPAPEPRKCPRSDQELCLSSSACTFAQAGVVARVVLWEAVRSVWRELHARRFIGAKTGEPVVDIRADDVTRRERRCLHSHVLRILPAGFCKVEADHGRVRIYPSAEPRSEQRRRVPDKSHVRACAKVRRNILWERLHQLLSCCLRVFNPRERQRVGYCASLLSVDVSLQNPRLQSFEPRGNLRKTRMLLGETRPSRQHLLLSAARAYLPGSRRVLGVKDYADRSASGRALVLRAPAHVDPGIADSSGDCAADGGARVSRGVDVAISEHRRSSIANARRWIRFTQHRNDAPFRRVRQLPLLRFEPARPKDAMERSHIDGVAHHRSRTPQSARTAARVPHHEHLDVHELDSGARARN